ncbi:MAG: hypothetical protein WBP64_16065 [Nitrososphaeraceae archaeon]
MVFNGSKFHIKPYNVAIHRWQCRRRPESFPTFPSSRSDENHAQIASDINWKPGRNVEGRTSTCSPIHDTSSLDTERETVKVSSITDFFYDDPNVPYTPLPEHDLEQSPCFSIISIKQGYFYLQAAY